MIGFLSTIGAAALGVVLFKVLSFVKINYMTSLNMKKRYGKAGDWAVVTGASEGIGHAMAIDLGRRGFNVCVIARTQSKLDSVIEELKQIGVEGKAIPFDFASATPQNYDKLFAELDKIQIAVLINNVGVNYSYTNYFDEVDLETDLRILKVNCEATVRMTKYIVPKMKAKRSGAIVVMGSVSAVVPAPFLCTYAGTKAFNVAFGSSLHYELKEFGIDVLAVSPNMVVSKMTQGVSTRKPRETFLMVNAAKMAHQTLNKLGSVPKTPGHVNHAFLEAVMTSLPVNLVSNKVLALHKSIKRKAERKRE
ncbi:putative mitochondrial short-chain dehydrogenase [Leptomonas pyrrhocoris]|uniref:Putative mitochondrial short-chain dehydrogenase n=1 Tax=Leptomonas pyrrhocoris TaxID=157538 RepID=A0A0N0VFV4_LEPPY|nr:putative mitochondrial short-chain dehydrogenase [Leptomonas pyrrhocoris]KPA81974.1 putative mitochondrial short-chain dehydrogenase [Leptomonas pyrrhocoris]|eukprot:XP_015660413.1 putative mitochondrial short-chain dehydrogenase [Leptomonas pyrrhocoris]